MKTKEQLAEVYANKEYTYNEDYDGFIAGYNAAIEKVVYYINCTASQVETNKDYYISDKYYEEIFKFLNNEG